MGLPNDRERMVNYEANSGGSGGGSTQKESPIISDLVHNLERLKVWLALSKEEPQIASQLLDRERVHEAAEALSGKGDDRARKEALRALGIYEEKEEEVLSQQKTVESVLKLEPWKSKKKESSSRARERGEFEDIWLVEKGGKRQSVEKWLAEIGLEKDLDQAFVNELRSRMEKIRDKYGVEELRGVELSVETMGEIDNRMALMRARVEFETGVKQAELRKNKTAVEVNYGEDLRKKDGILQIRNADKASSDLQEVIDRVKEYVNKDVTLDELNGLAPEDLVKRFEDANKLLSNMDAYYDKSFTLEDRKRLRATLAALQRQYQEQLAKSVAKQWKDVDNKPEEWGEIASKALERVIKKRRKIFHEKVEFEGVDEKEKYVNIKKEMTGEGRSAVEELKKAKWRSGKPKETDRGGEPDDREWAKTRQWKELDKELDKILIKDGYNPFEDKDFWKDLAESGEEGIDRIIERAEKSGIGDADKFRELLLVIRSGKDALAMGARRSGVRGLEEQLGAEGQLEILGELIFYLNRRDFGAAANKMLEYTTRVGMQENSNDLQFLYVRRMFLEKISKVSPDFAEQFQKNQAMNYLPGLTAQKPEDFYGVQLKIFAKGNTDLFFGDNAFMSGNLVRLEDGREIVISTKSFLAALRSERHQMRIFRAEPNTMDSTLQTILLEEMYGQGTRMVLSRDGDGNQAIRLRRPGQDNIAEMDLPLLRDIKIDSRYAELGIGGFDDWKDYNPNPGLPEQGIPSTNEYGYEMSLEDILNRDQWMLRNAAQFMWYSEMWMDTLKSYQPSIMKNTAKALETAASAIADYKAQFELVAPPFLDIVQKIGDMLGPMERYKAADMVAGNIADELTKKLSGARGRDAMSEDNRKQSRARDEAIGNLFKKIFVRQAEIEVNGEKVKVNNRTRNREMTRMAFNNLAEFDDEVARLVQEKLVNLDMYEGDIPSIDELKEMYQDWLDANDSGSRASGKTAYMGQEYAAVWREIEEMKLSNSDRALWNSLTKEELGVLIEMNEAVTGIHYENVNKDNFFRNFEIEAFIDWTGTKHGDDWEQFGMKYAPGKMEALKIVIKIAGGEGTVEDYAKLYDALSLFAKPEEKRIILTALMERQHLMTSEQWVVPYEVADIKPKYDENGNVIRKGSAEIDWINYTDSNGKEYFARTVEGTRAYNKKKYRGNYARQVLGKDMWRPHDFEAILEYLRGKQILDKQEKYELKQKILGTRRGVEYFANGIADRLGIPRERMKGFVDVVSRSSSWVKLQALNLFFFQDPKYALWTFAEEVVGLGGKTFEHIFGFAVGGKK